MFLVFFMLINPLNSYSREDASECLFSPMRSPEPLTFGFTIVYCILYKNLAKEIKTALDLAQLAREIIEKS